MTLFFGGNTASRWALPGSVKVGCKLRTCIQASERNTTKPMQPRFSLVRFLVVVSSIACVASIFGACANLTAPASEQSSESQQTTGVPAKPRASAMARPEQQPAPAPAEEKIAASHILVGYKGAMRSRSERTKEEAKKIATELAARAKKGEDFAELARKHSEGPSAPRGGQLNEFTRKQMVKPFADAAFALQVGQVSDPVESPFGFHVIKRTK